MAFNVANLGGGCLISAIRRRREADKWLKAAYSGGWLPNQSSLFQWRNGRQ